MEEQPTSSDHPAHQHEGDHHEHEHDSHEHDSHEHDSHEHGHDKDIRRRGGFIITALTSGHGVFHWFSQSFTAMSPVVQVHFGLSFVAMGGIATTREIASGLVTLPGGVIADAFRKYWGLILGLCMAVFGVGWLVIGLAPDGALGYPVLLVGMAIVGIASSIWHLPAMASLSHHFTRRRGTALSFHGVGGQVGDALAPPVTGLLLGFMAWKDIISIYAAVPIFLAFLVYWSFRYIGRDSQDQDVAPSRNEQWQATKGVLRNRVLWVVAFVGGVRGMAFLALVTFLPMFLRDLGMSPFVWNLHLGLLMAVGIVSTPVVGYLSDRLGRKNVLIPGMLFLAVLTFFLSSAASGPVLILIIALLGTFLFGDQPVLTALALDVSEEGVATTVLGVLSFARFLFAAPSPIIAGWIYDSRGAGDTFLYVAALFVVGAVVLLFVPAPKTDFSAASGHHH